MHNPLIMKLSTYMRLRGYRDRHMAELIGLERSTVSRLRRDDCRPSWEVMERLAALTDGEVLPNDFLLGTSPDRDRDHP